MKSNRVQKGKVNVHRNYGPQKYYIIDKIHNKGIGQAYVLANAEGRRLRGLINGDRLKLYQNDRTTLDLLCPPLMEQKLTNAEGNSPQAKESQSESQTQATGQGEWFDAIRILKSNGKTGKSTRFLVLFTDQSTNWCKYDDVSPFLRRQFALRKRKKKKRSY